MLDTVFSGGIPPSSLGTKEKETLNVCSLKVMIKDGLERNHSKVQIASLELFSEAFLACPALFEEPLMELLPPTLVLCNARNQQAQTKAATLRDELGRHLPAAYLCPAIVHSIRSVRHSDLFPAFPVAL